MDHIHYQEEISQFIDNELPENESPELFAHLSTCPECRGFFNESLQLKSRLTSISVPSIPANSKGNLWNSSHIRRESALRGLSQFNSRPDSTIRQLPVIVLMLFMLVVGGLLFSTKVEVQHPQEHMANTSGLSPLENPSMR